MQGDQGRRRDRDGYVGEVVSTSRGREGKREGMIKWGEKEIWKNTFPGSDGVTCIHGVGRDSNDTTLRDHILLVREVLEDNTEMKLGC